MSTLEKTVEKILPRVSKPTRYLGDEWNTIKKEHSSVDVTALLAFPDIYEVGMSHLGLKILYYIINNNKDMLAERVYAPWTDMEEEMRQEGVPLFSLESKTSARKFDILGFTLQFELSYTNILNMLELAQIPLLAEKRDESYPLIIGGGPGAFNPEPIAPFFDLFFLGEGEENIVTFLALYKEYKRSGQVSRLDFLKKIARLPGFYVPSFYKDSYDKEGNFLGTKSLLPEAPGEIKKTYIKDLDEAPFPEEFIVPYMDIVHDRLMLEIFRGCTRGCRFCQAGMIYRPVRERSIERLKALALKLVETSGYEEMSLSSLSSSDYSRILDLVKELSADLKKKGVNLSLPSLRLDSFSLQLAEEVQKVRKSGLTFAPEAGTQRLRDVINKNINEEDILMTLEEAFRAGWSTVKLYFMIGLPTETEEDIKGISELSHRVLKLGRSIVGNRTKVTVNTSTFVPKPHTPFQWVPQITRDEMREKQNYLRNSLRGRGLKYNWHDPANSFLEGVLSRGDRRLAQAIEKAFKLGCKFDSWSEFFDLDKWSQAFEEEGINPLYYTEGFNSSDAPLPWDHLQSGVNKNYLAKEYEKALQGETSPDCRQGKCIGCGVTSFTGEKEGVEMQTCE